jgi:hypothetical protein
MKEGVAKLFRICSLKKQFEIESPIFWCMMIFLSGSRAQKG